MISKKFKNNILFAFFFLLASAMVPLKAEAQNPIVILIESKAPKTIYNIDGKEYTLDKLFNHLGDEIRTKGKNNPVVVIANDETKISTIYNVRGVIEKKGFLNTRYFISNKDKTMMAEITMNKPAIPFALEGDLLKEK